MQIDGFKMLNYAQSLETIWGQCFMARWGRGEGSRKWASEKAFCGACVIFWKLRAEQATERSAAPARRCGCHSVCSNWCCFFPTAVDRWSRPARAVCERTEYIPTYLSHTGALQTSVRVFTTLKESSKSFWEMYIVKKKKKTRHGLKKFGGTKINTSYHSVCP